MVLPDDFVSDNNRLGLVDGIIAAVTILFLISMFIIQLEGNKSVDEQDESFLYRFMIWFGAFSFFLDNFASRLFSTIEGMNHLLGRKKSTAIRDVMVDQRGGDLAPVSKWYDTICLLGSLLLVGTASFLGAGPFTLVSAVNTWSLKGADRLIGVPFFVANSFLTFWFRKAKTQASLMSLFDKLADAPWHKRLGYILLLAALGYAARPYARYYSDIYARKGLWGALAYVNVDANDQVKNIVDELVFCCAIAAFALSGYQTVLKILSSPRAFFKTAYEKQGFWASTAIGACDTMAAAYFAVKLYSLSDEHYALSAAYALSYYCFYVLDYSVDANSELLGALKSPGAFFASLSSETQWLLVENDSHINDGPHSQTPSLYGDT